MKNRIFVLVFVGILLALALTACGGGIGEPSATSTPMPLTIWDYEDVCRQGTIDKAADYDGEAGKIHPLVLYRRDGADETTYHQMMNSTLELPVPWVIDYEGDATTVELVACITRVSEEHVDVCEFGDEEEPDKVYLLNLYDASYEVELIAAKTGEVVGTTTFDVPYEECPMFHMFSDDEDDSYAYIEGADLKPFLEEFVTP